MALHGSLETLGLEDVLALLSGTNKTGELRINSDRLVGRLWFTDGQLVGADVGVSQSLTDAVFELLRLDQGTFSFDQDRKAPQPNSPTPIGLVLSEAQSRLDEWREIEKVVPSPHCGVTLKGELEPLEVVVSKEQWTLIVAFGKGGHVDDLVTNWGYSEFDACRTIRDMVESGLFEVTQAPISSVFDEVKDREVLHSLVSQDHDLSDTSDEETFGDIERLEALNDYGIDASATSDVPADVSTEADTSRDDQAASVLADELRGDSGDTGDSGSGHVASRAIGSVESEDRAEAAWTKNDSSAESADRGAHVGEEMASSDYEVFDDEDEINRGALLKFLSSVRN